MKRKISIAGADGLLLGAFELDLEAILEPYFQHLLNLERNIMSQLDDLTTQVTALETAVAAANAKSDTLIATLNTVQTELLAAQSGGTAIDLTSLIARVGAVVGSVNSEASKEDAAIAAAPSAPTPPAPAPATGP